MDETGCVSRQDFATTVRNFLQRLQTDDEQQVLWHAVLLDITLEGDSAGEMLGLNHAGVKAAGEAIRASFRAYQQGDQARAVSLAAGVLSAVAGQESEAAEPARAATRTLSLLRAPDGSYWIRVLDEQVFPMKTRETTARVVGPLQRNQVFHQLKLLGLTDRQGDAFVEKVDVERSAEIRGVRNAAGT